MSFVGGKGDAVDTESHDEDLVRFRASSDPQLCVGPLHLSRAQLPRPIRGRIQDNQVARVHVGQVDHLTKENFQIRRASLFKRFLPALEVSIQRFAVFLCGTTSQSQEPCA